MSTEDQQRANNNLCPEGYGCPNCGEQNIDHLLINDDDVTVSCLTCGTDYTVPQESV
jgi:uncharacterized Zn finger protein